MTNFIITQKSAISIQSSTSWPSREITIDKVKSQDMREEKEVQLIGTAIRVSTTETDSVKCVHPRREDR